MSDILKGVWEFVILATLGFISIAVFLIVVVVPVVAIIAVLAYFNVLWVVPASIVCVVIGAIVYFKLPENVKNFVDKIAGEIE